MVVVVATFALASLRTTEVATTGRIASVQYRSIPDSGHPARTSRLSDGVGTICSTRLFWGSGWPTSATTPTWPTSSQGRQPGQRGAPLIGPFGFPGFFSAPKLEFDASPVWLGVFLLSQVMGVMPKRQGFTDPAGCSIPKQLYTERMAKCLQNPSARYRLSQPWS